MEPKDSLKADYTSPQGDVKDVLSQKSIAGQQSTINFPENHLQKDGIAEDDKHKSRQLLLFQEGLESLKRWVIATMDSFISNIGKDVGKISQLSRQQDVGIYHLYSSNLLLDKSYSRRVQGLIMKSDVFEKRSMDIQQEMDQNMYRLRELKKQSSNCKKTAQNHIIQNNTQLFLEICQIGEEIEIDKTRFQKEIAASDERRRISMDSTRFRLLTSNSYTKNAFTVWKKAVLTQLARTKSKLRRKQEEDQQYWKREMELVSRKIDEDLDAFGRNISQLEDTTKRRIEDVVKKVDKLAAAVNIDTCENEDFRKVMRNSMALSKGQSERLLRMKNDLAAKTREIGETINTMETELESQCETFLDEIKDHNKQMDKQINDISRQIKLLKFRIRRQDPESPYKYD